MISGILNAIMGLALLGVLAGTAMEGGGEPNVEKKPLPPEVRQPLKQRVSRPGPSVRMWTPPRPRRVSVRQGSRSYSSRRRSFTGGGWRSGK